MYDGMYCGDAISLMKKLSDDSIDLIVTDPAYESIEKHRDHGTTTRLKESSGSSNVWFDYVPNSYFPPFLSECYRVLKNNTYMFIMCDPDTQFILYSMLGTAGFKVKTPLIWVKLTKNDYPVTCSCGKSLVCDNCHTVYKDKHPSMGMGYPFRRSYEVIMFAVKGYRSPPDNKKIRDTLMYPRLKGGVGWSGEDLFPSEKPIELSKMLILQSSVEGDIVLDPFAGSGSVLEAARRLNRRFLGFDIKQETVDRYMRLSENI